MTMWNRIQTAANSTTTTLIQTPAELLPRHHKRQRPRRRFALDDDEDFDQFHDNHRSGELDPDKQFWQDSFDSRLNALAIANNPPCRYEIQRGKTVPSPSHTPLSGSKDHLPGLNSDVNTNTPPLSNPPRRRFQSESGWRPTNASDDNLTHTKHARHESEALPAASRSTTTLSPLGKMYPFGRRNTDAQGVSPPSSPEMNPVRPRHDVSPIDDDADMSQQRTLKGPRPAQVPASRPTQSRIPPPQAHSRQSSGQQPKSSIPMMRRERRKQQQDAAPAAAHSSRPNQREHGRQTPPVSSRSPTPNHNSMGWTDPAGGRLTPTLGPPSDEDPGYGVSTTITSHTSRQSQTPSPSFGHRIRQFGRSKPEPIESRPAWNGASGRQAIVEPVRDDKQAAPLKVPPKSSRRMERTKEKQPPGDTPISPRGPETSHGSSTAAAMRKIFPSGSGHTPEPKDPTTESATYNAAQPAQAYPSPPAQSPPALQSQTGTPRLKNTPPAPSLTIPDSEKAIKRKPPPTGQTPTLSHAVQPSTSSSIYSAQPEGLGLAASPHPITSSSSRPPVSDENWVQPSSRFSITTYATSAGGSPRQSQEEDRPPVPEMPPVTSVMDRRRPVHGSDSPKAAGGDEPLVISLKSASVSNPMTGLDRERQHPPRSATDIKKSERSASISTNKALPLAPPEMVESKDRVVILSAKLEGLAHRRNNITKSVKQMTELMPADRLLESAEVLRKREEEKKKVERLKEELAEIQQQEYDLGLKLHRAYKRQDRDAEYESGTLWVRRFTD